MFTLSSHIGNAEISLCRQVSLDKQGFLIWFVVQLGSDNLIHTSVSVLVNTASRNPISTHPWRFPAITSAADRRLTQNSVPATRRFTAGLRDVCFDQITICRQRVSSGGCVANQPWHGSRAASRPAYSKTSPKAPGLGGGSRLFVGLVFSWSKV